MNSWPVDMLSILFSNYIYMKTKCEDGLYKFFTLSNGVKNIKIGHVTMQIYWRVVMWLCKYIVEWSCDYKYIVEWSCDYTNILLIGHVTIQIYCRMVMWLYKYIVELSFDYTNLL